MPEIRQSIATKEWVIVATERAKRPHEFANESQILTAERPAWDATCPFCPGREEPPPMEQLRVPSSGLWELRVLRNRFPALALEGERVRTFDGVHRVMSGVGMHELIVESRLHNTCLALQTTGQVANTLLAFQARGVAYAGDIRIEHLVYFENHGEEAGTSIEHPHAQMVGLPVVPYDVRNRVEEAQRYFDDTGNCVYCDLWQGELAEGRRVIATNQHFIALIPYAAFSPFHTWIIPRRHQPNYLAVGDLEMHSLADILRTVLRRIYVGLRDPAYNFIIRSAPLREVSRECLHWYLTIIPRVSESAGFELGTGMFINTALPEESAAFLRAVQTDNP